MTNSPDLQSAFDTAVSSAASARANVVEAACEKALQGGVCGVAIVDLTGPIAPVNDRAGLTHVSVHLLVGPHPAVPYGQILEFPSEAAFEAYVDRRQHERQGLD